MPPLWKNIFASGKLSRTHQGNLSRGIVKFKEHLNTGLFNNEHFNPGLFNNEFLNHGVEKFVVEKSGIEKPGVGWNVISLEG